MKKKEIPSPYRNITIALPITSAITPKSLPLPPPKIKGDNIAIINPPKAIFSAILAAFSPLEPSQTEPSTSSLWSDLDEGLCWL